MSIVHEWLATHQHGVPAALSAHMAGAVHRSDHVADELMRAGERMMARAIAPSPMTRSDALDVLGADALVTCAFEAASDEPQSLRARADRSMQAIAALAGGTQ